MPAIKILCAADLHMGRRPSRLPEAWQGGRVSSATAWGHLVDHALAEEADLVLLAGDVVDELNRSFEAYGPLEAGLRRLKEGGVPVVAVAGNHDFEALPDLAAEVADGHLVVLGRKARWERWTLEDDAGEPRLHVDGWSFPRKHHTEDPTGGYDPDELAGGTDAASDAGDRVPVVGLLHADLDQTASRYAPVASATLRGQPVDAWILGHIHRPTLHERPGSAPILYPGSLQALDPGEGGMHGAWLVEIKPDGAPSFHLIPLSGAHYATVEIDVEGIDEPGDLNARVRSALTEHLSGLAEAEPEFLQIACCRVRLTGRSALHNRLADVLEGMEDFDPGGQTADIRLSVDPRLIIDTRPALDLDDLARGNDAPAHLARLLLSVEDPDPDLLEAASRAASKVTTSRHFVGARLDALDTSSGCPAVRDALQRQAARLLDALVAGRQDA